MIRSRRAGYGAGISTPPEGTLVGKSLGQYQIIEALGSGGMGEVYRAHDTNLKRDVAIKVLPEDLAADELRLLRLEREARLLASVNHPNIATIHNLEAAGGTLWLVLELVEGEALDQRLDRGPLPLGETLRIGRQVAAALEAAHAKGIIHRDLKPANVMVDATGVVKVLDFGVAKSMSAAGSAPGAGTAGGDDDAAPGSLVTRAATDLAAHLTGTGMLVGTAPYMSPEQIRGRGLDKRSDIWSFGCLLYELTTGRRPFDRETMADTLAAILEQEPDWGALPQGTPAAVQALLRRCLQKDADLRLHDIADARIEIDDLVATSPGDRSVDEAPALAAGRPAPTTAQTAPAATTTAARRAAPWLAIVAVAAIGAAALWFGAGAGSDGSGAFRSAVNPSSIAVLPFANIGDDPANAPIADGLAEALLNTLAKISGVTVTARTSSFQFKDRPEEITEIGRQLNVATILEGSAQRAGEQVRITVRLVDASNGATLWSDVYDRQYEPAAIFAFYEDIARRVAGELEVELLGEDAARLAEAPTDNAQAFDAYLRGNDLLARYTNDAFRAAARNFEQAIDLDPSFALAYVGLADAYLLQNSYGVLPLDEALAVAEPAIARALQIDDRSGEALAMSGFALGLAGDTDGELAAYQRAIELSPNSARAHQLYWWRLFTLGEGDSERAGALVARALELDPRSAAHNENYGWSLFEVGRFAEALVYFEKTVEYEPSYPFGYSALGLYSWYLGRLDEAIAFFERAVDLSPETTLFRKNLGLAHAAAGHAEEAIAHFSAIIEVAPAEAGRYRDIGDVYWRVLGRPVEAIEGYRQAVDLLPAQPLFMLSLVLLHLDLDDPAAAERWAAQAEAAAPDNVWSKIARLNVEMYEGRYVEGRTLARDLAETARWRGYLFQFEDPYAEYAPTGYFGLLAGEPAEAAVFPTRAYPGLRDDDPVINGFNVNAAIDLAAAYKAAGEGTRADLLLAKSMAFVESRSDELRRFRYREEPVEIFALQGRVPEALAALGAAIDQGWRVGWWRLRHKPHYAALRDEPQFQAMLAELEADAERMRRLVEDAPRSLERRQPR